MDILQQTLITLKKHAETISERSYVPYTGRKEGVIIMMEDGSLVAGARVENASFQLTIPALHNAISTAYALQRKDFSIVVSSVPLTEAELAYTGTLGNYHWEQASGYVLLVAGAHHPDPIDFLPISIPTSVLIPEDGTLKARVAAKSAFIPESDFPVGCVVVTTSCEEVQSVNVEHSDWHHILCAERNALSTMVSYGLGTASSLYVSCPKLPGGTPCGACRQVIVELAPKATVWMDLGSEKPQSMKATELLPGHFSGDVLRKS